MSTDTDDRNSLALDLLLSSVRGRRLPEGRHATAAVAEALALADAFLAATPRTYMATLAPPPGSPLALIDEIDRIFPAEPGRARELLTELRSHVIWQQFGQLPSEEPPAAPAFSDGTCPDCRQDCASWVAMGEGCKRPAAVAPEPDPNDDVRF